MLNLVDAVHCLSSTLRTAATAHGHTSSAARQRSSPRPAQGSGLPQGVHGQRRPAPDQQPTAYEPQGRNRATHGMAGGRQPLPVRWRHGARGACGGREQRARATGLQCEGAWPWPCLCPMQSSQAASATLTASLPPLDLPLPHLPMQSLPPLPVLHTQPTCWGRCSRRSPLRTARWARASGLLPMPLLLPPVLRLQRLAARLRPHSVQACACGRRSSHYLDHHDSKTPSFKRQQRKQETCPHTRAWWSTV